MRFLSFLKHLVRRTSTALGYDIHWKPASIRFTRIEKPAVRNIGVEISPAQNASILSTVKAHLDQSVTDGNLPSLGERWGSYAKRLRERIAKLDSTEKLLLLAQSPEAGVETHLTSSELITFCQSLDLMCLDDDVPDALLALLPSFSAPSVTPASWLADYRGRKIDFVSACAAANILMALHWLGNDWPRSVCDIGGGTGKYAYSWLTNGAHRPELVVILDIPETLVFSEALLRYTFGDEKVQYITSETTTPNATGVVLCPIGNAKAIEGLAFDLVMNIGSMQEMSDAWIDYYMAWLDRQQCRYFYSANYFGSSLTEMYEGHCSYAPRPSAKWSLLQHRVYPGMRSSATTFYKKTSGIGGAGDEVPARGLAGWIEHLERARLNADEGSYRRALTFACATLPFIPKEAWQVAKTLAGITGAPDDAAEFDRLDRLRRGGHEAAH